MAHISVSYSQQVLQLRLKLVSNSRTEKVTHYFLMLYDFHYYVLMWQIMSIYFR